MRLAVALLLVLATTGPVAAEATKTAAMNAVRSAAGLPRLSYAPALEDAAARHARDMLRARFFSHTGSDGSDVGARVHRAGYRWCFVAENIAQGQPDLAQVMEAWMTSPGHRANMLSPDVTEFALVQAEGYIWVMVLARPGC